jgi:hypothetical protein
MNYQQRMDYLITTSATIAAQLHELKALRMQVKRCETVSATEPAVQKLDACMHENSPAGKRGAGAEAPRSCPLLG